MDTFEQDLRDHYNAREERWANAKAEQYLGPAAEPDATPTPSAPAVSPVEGAVAGATHVAGTVMKQVQRGGQQMADAIAPVDQNATGLGRIWSAVQGLGNLLAPFSDAGGEVLGHTFAAMELSDEQMKAQLEQARLNAPGLVPMYEHLAAIPYEQRKEMTRQSVGFVGEIAAGFLGLPLGEVLNPLKKAMTNQKMGKAFEEVLRRAIDAAGSETAPVVRSGASAAARQVKEQTQ